MKHILLPVFMPLFWFLPSYAGVPTAIDPPTSPSRTPQDALDEKLNLRDPFKIPAIFTIDTTPKSELEMLETDKFKLVGVITGPDQVKAIIQSPSGRNHIVTEKMAIGPHGGKIAKITPDWIQIREKQLNVVGHEQSVMSYIHLPSEHSVRTNSKEKLVDKSIQDISRDISRDPSKDASNAPPNTNSNDLIGQTPGSASNAWQNSMNQNDINNQQNIQPNTQQNSIQNSQNSMTSGQTQNQNTQQFNQPSMNNPSANTDPNTAAAQFMNSNTNGAQRIDTSLQNVGLIPPPQIGGQ